MPVNRIVAFLGPAIAVLAGAIATWLFTHVHLFSIFEHDHAKGWVEQGLVFTVTAVLVWLGEHDWIKGWQIWETAAAGTAQTVTEDAAAPPPAGQPPAPHSGGY